MKKLLSLLLVAIMAMSSLAVSYAENMEDGSNYSISATQSENDEAANDIRQAIMNAQIQDRERFGDSWKPDGYVENREVTSDGIHVATRRSNSYYYKEITTKFTLGSTLGTVSNSTVYFMHYLYRGNLSVDGGIYFRGQDFYIYHFGSIDVPGKWSENPTPLNLSPGDTVFVTTTIGNGKITTKAYVYYSDTPTILGSWTNNLTTAAATSANNGAQVCREMNVARHAPIDNTATFFSWTEAESSMVRTNDTLYKMSSSNSVLDDIAYDKEGICTYTHCNCNRTYYTSNGYIMDRAWCRCNFY